MNPRLNALTRLLGSAARSTARRAGTLMRGRTALFAGTAALALGSVWLIVHPPLQTVPRGEVVMRSNLLTGAASQHGEGSLLVLPGLHGLRHFSLRDQVWRPQDSARATGAAPFQSIEGLSLGVDLTIRYALDPARIGSIARSLPDDLGQEVVQPAVRGVIYKTFTRYTVREIYSAKRAEIQQQIEAELKPQLAADGIVLKAVQMGQVDLPAEYRQGMDRLLAEELATEKMRFTLALKAKQVEQTVLEAEADRVRREKQAQAAANEQVIAAKAQEEAMKHVLPFKEKQIAQRQLEAEAEKQSRIRAAEGNAQARRIEAAGEAESRQKLADAEGYRLERVGRISSEQMARDGAVLSRHPLLIQKAIADKLSDKVSVIIAPPPTDGGFIASALIGKLPAATGQALARADDAKDGE